jgi:hypothetical protein
LPSLLKMASRKPKLAAQAPGIIRRRTLKVLGTFISLLEAVRMRASADLAFEALDCPTCQRKAALDPEAYHIYDQTFHNLSIVW